MENLEPVLISGEWRAADATDSFRAINPDTGEELEHEYPVSSRADVDAALRAGAEAAEALTGVERGAIADFLERYADLIDERAAELAATASLETALPVSPRLKDVELPRTTNQLRQAAGAARDRSWTQPAIDSANNIRSMFGPLGGPVAVFGPNNFPLAFNGAAGGDFASAIAAGNPVIVKAHPSHPRTSQRLLEAAFEALQHVGLPAATVQAIYHMSYDDGAYLVSHPLIAATGYTGSQRGGLALKKAADAAGKPIYLEMSSINPVFMLPGALRERGAELSAELYGSALMGTGQFCTNPGVIVLQAGEDTEAFIDGVRAGFESAPAGTLLGSGGVEGLVHAVGALRQAGAEVITGGSAIENQGCRFENTLLRVSGAEFVGDRAAFQEEAFGNANLFVVADSEDELESIARSFEGNLTGCIYSDTHGSDDALYDRIAPHLRRRVGRLLNDKMPTGVAVTGAMNHGGPFPATGHPGFTAVGMPTSIPRFAMLECYDNVREARLPAELRDANPTGSLWRTIDGEWSQADVSRAVTA